MDTDAAAVRAGPDDADAIRRAREHPEAFTAVFDRHYRAVHRYLARRVGPHTADDLTSETFLRGLAAVDRYDLSYPDARPWLLGIATNLVGAHLRAEVRGYRALARTGVDPHHGPAHDHADAVAARVSAQAGGAALGRALAGLAAGDRDVLLLVAYAALTYEEVAVALAIPVGTVRSRLNRARTKVRRVLEVSAAEASS